MVCFINSRCSNKIVANLGTKNGTFSSAFLKIQSKIKKSSQFSLLQLLQFSAFVLVFVTKKIVNILHVFLCGMGSCEWIIRLPMKGLSAIINAAAMFRKKSSITTQIKSLNIKCLHTHTTKKILSNLDIGDMIKNKSSFCNVFNIIREMMHRLLKKYFL